MRPAGAGFIYDHAVGAYQPVNERLDADGSKPCFAVGDHDARLHNITRNNLCLQARIDNFQIHPVVGDLAAFKARALHFANDGQNNAGDVQIVDAAIAVAEKRSGLAVHRAQQLLFWLFLEPAVDVVAQKRGIALEHPVIILAGNVQIGADLLMRGLLNLQRLDLVDALTVEHTDHRAVAPGIHVQTVGCDQIVCLCLLLAQDLAAHILNTASAFHLCVSLPSKNLP